MNIKEIKTDFPFETFETDTELKIIKTIDKTHHGDLIHISISHKNRHPNWNELIEIKRFFFGDNIDAMMIMPKSEDYVNIHKNCFHIWQTPVSWGIR